MLPFISQYGTKPKTSCPGDGTDVGVGIGVRTAVGLGSGSGEASAAGTVGDEPRSTYTRAIVTATATAATPIKGRRVMAVACIRPRKRSSRRGGDERRLAVDRC